MALIDDHLYIGQATVYFDHRLTGLQIAECIELNSRLTLALKSTVHLRESTVRDRILSIEELVFRLSKRDWIEFDNETGIGLAVWATSKALRVEFTDPEYEWSSLLCQPSKLAELHDIVECLSRQFDSRCALLASSSHRLKSSVTYEFFAEAISMDELMRRTYAICGSPFTSFAAAQAAMQSAEDAPSLPLELSNGYFLWCS